MQTQKQYFQRYMAKDDWGAGGINDEMFTEALKEANKNRQEPPTPTAAVRKPYVGETVLFTPNPGDTVAKSNYNNDDVAAIVTRVWGPICVNIKLIPDCGPMQDRTSVIHQSQNPAGYHFRFIGEEKISTSDKLAPTSDEVKDASAFLEKH